MITFIGLPDRSSGIIRGMQIASHIPNAEFINSVSGAYRKPNNKIVIFIRSLDRGYANLLRNMGYTVGYDLLDRPVADEHAIGTPVDWGQYAKLPCNFFIVNNAAARQKLQTLKPVFTIPHHHVGLSSEPRKSIKTIGYVGLPDQFDHSEKVREFCEKNNLTFLSENPLTYDACDDVLKRIDVGCIYVDVKPRTVPVLAYKPNTKLTNFQSFATPTICCKYESFIEFGEEKYRLVESPDEMINSIQLFLDDSSLYRNLSEESLVVGRKFQITNIVSLYNAIVESYASS